MEETNMDYFNDFLSLNKIEAADFELSSLNNNSQTGDFMMTVDHQQADYDYDHLNNLEDLCPFNVWLGPSSNNGPSITEELRTLSQDSNDLTSSINDVYESFDTDCFSGDDVLIDELTNYQNLKDDNSTDPRVKPCSVRLDATAVLKYYAAHDVETKIKTEMSRPATVVRTASSETEMRRPATAVRTASSETEVSRPATIVRTASSETENTSSESFYQCPYCLLLFLQESELIFHTNQKFLNASKFFIKGVPEIYECTNCTLVFDNHRQFHKHMITDHNSCIDCRICKKYFTYVCELSAHQKQLSHLYNYQISCKLCKLDFINQYTYDFHNYSFHHSLHSCNICMIGYPNSMKLAHHNLLAHNFKIHKNTSVLNFNTSEDIKSAFKIDVKPIKTVNNNNNSKVIKKSLLNDLTLKTDIEVVCVKKEPTNKDVYEFSDNDITTKIIDTNVKKLKSSSRKNSNDKDEKFQCDYCKNSFKLLINYKKHYDKVHSDKLIPEKLLSLISTQELCCTLCKSKPYQSELSLTKHIEQFHRYDHLLKFETLNINCSHCEEKFENEMTLYMHTISKHNKTIEYKCQQCNVSFNSPCTFSTHYKNIHNEFKIFNCKFCKLSFHSTHFLSEHLKRCHNVPTFHCLNCSNDIFYREYLNKHYRVCGNINNIHVHKTELPVCCLCGLKMQSITMLFNHTIKHLTIHKNTLHCDKCANIFFTKFNFIRHYKKQHLLKKHL